MRSLPREGLGRPEDGGAVRGRRQIMDEHRQAGLRRQLMSLVNPSVAASFVQLNASAPWRL